MRPIKFRVWKEVIHLSKPNEYKKTGDWKNTGDGEIRTWDIGYDKLNKYAGQEGNASRFFKSIAYYPKASKSERNRGCENIEPQKRDEGRKEGNPGGDNPRNRGIHLRTNNHPTVKPIALMEYLVKLVSREGQLILDPFAGSGSTLIACKNLKRNFIGIEKEEEYVKIANARLKSVPNKLI